MTFYLICAAYYYLLAFVFSLTGFHSLLTVRLVGVAFSVLYALMIYAVARNISDHTFAFIAPFTFILYAQAAGFFFGARQIFGLASILACLLWLRKPSPRLLLVAGTLSGVQTIFSHEVGFCSLASISALLLIKSRLTKLSSFKMNISTFLAPYFVVTVPIATYFLASVPFEKLYYCLIYYPLFVFPHAELNLPFPTILTRLWMGLLFNAPVVIYAIAAILALKYLRNRDYGRAFPILS